MPKMSRAALVCQGFAAFQLDFDAVGAVAVIMVADRYQPSYLKLTG